MAIKPSYKTCNATNADGESKNNNNKKTAHKWSATDHDDVVKSLTIVDDGGDLLKLEPPPARVFYTTTSNQQKTWKNENMNEWQKTYDAYQILSSCMSIFCCRCCYGPHMLMTLFFRTLECMYVCMSVIIFFVSDIFTSNNRMMNVNQECWICVNKLMDRTVQNATELSAPVFWFISRFSVVQANNEQPTLFSV